MYPSITQYATAISIPESFATKSTLRPVLKEDGTPYFSAGGYAVVFQMQCEETGRRYALKCFTREQEHRTESFRKISEHLAGLDTPYLLPYEYLEDELWVEDADYPVLLMEWVDGDTLDCRLAALCRNGETEIARLAGAFDALGVWLLEQELAHGDLKPDNIIIRPSGQPVLIDYDGMFVPAMAGEESRELGTQDWRHPQRKYSDFNRHLDDFPILVISLSLHVFAAAPDLYHRNGNADNLLFTEADFLNPYTSNAFVQARAWQSHEDIAPRLALLQYAVSLPLLQLIGLEVYLRRTAKEVLLFEEPDESFEIVWEEEYCGFRNHNGEMITDCKYEYANSFCEGYAKVCQNSKSGFINKQGDLVIPMIYQSAESYSEGLALVSKKWKYGFIDKQGNEVVPMIYEYAFSFQDGVAKVIRNGLYGFIDKQGNEVVPMIYEYAFSFRDGMAKVIQNGLYGFIDKQGNEVVPMIYKYVFSFRDGMAKVTQNGQWGFINKLGNMVISMKYVFAKSFNEGLALVGNYKWGYIDKRGKMVIPMIYDCAKSFREGLALVWINGKCGFIDKQGDIVISMVYQSAESFSEGLALVKENGKYGFINKQGDVVIQMKYDNAKSFSEGLALVWENGKCGFIDKQGDIVIPMIYKSAESFSEGLALVENYQCGFINKLGKMVIPMEYYYAKSFKEGLAVVAVRQNFQFEEYDEYGFIDKDGNVIVWFSYDSADSFREGLAEVRDNGNRYYIDIRDKSISIPYSSYFYMER